MSNQPLAPVLPPGQMSGELWVIGLVRSPMHLLAVSNHSKIVVPVFYDGDDVCTFLAQLNDSQQYGSDVLALRRMTLPQVFESIRNERRHLFGRRPDGIYLPEIDMPMELNNFIPA